MPKTIADAIHDSNCEFTFCYSTHKIQNMKKPLDPRVSILKNLVDDAGGPAEFARKYSCDAADKPIDPTYISQLLNGHREFRDKARINMAKRAGLPDGFFEHLPARATGATTQTLEARQDTAIYGFMTETTIQVVTIMSKLSHEDQNKILNFAKFTENEAPRDSNNSIQRAGQ